MDNDFSPALAAIARFDWCHPAVAARPDTALLAEVYWWERRDQMAERLQATEAACRSSQPAASPLADELHFCLAYAAMSSGDTALLDTYSQRISSEHTGPCLRQWLQVETAGRTREYAAQAQLVSRLLKQHSTLPDWLATACFASLNHRDVKAQPLLTVLSKHPVSTPLACLLTARLLAAAGLPEQAYKVLAGGRSRWPEAAALYWFEGLVRAQMGDTALSLSLIDTAQQKGLVCMATLRTWLDTLVSKPLAISHTQLPAAFARAQAQVATDARQSAELASYRIIQSWIEGDLRTAHGLLTQHHSFQHMEERDTDRAAQIFMRYAVYLCIAWQHNQHLYQSQSAQPAPPLYVLGESHSLTSSNISLDWHGAPHKAHSCFMMGVTMWSLAQPNLNRYKAKLHEHLQAITDMAAPLLLLIGEIDCRPEGGLWKTHKKTGRPLAVLLNQTINGYLQHLDNALEGRQQVTLAGVPAPKYTFEGQRDPGNAPAFLAMIAEVNQRLKQGALARGWSFLDLYRATAAPDGRSNGQWHLDGWHLQPAFYAQAQQWLVTP